jgi:hypothetical protein
MRKERWNRKLNIRQNEGKFVRTVKKEDMRGLRKKVETG